MLKKLPILNDPYLMRLFSYLPPYKKYIVWAGISMIVGGGASSLIALVFGKLTDMGFYQQDSIVLYLAPLALVGITILHGGTQYLSGYLLALVSQNVLIEVRTKMFERVLHWSDESFYAHRSSEVQSKFINEAANALSQAASVMTIIIRDSLQIVCLVVVLIYHNWLLTLVSFAVAPLLALVLSWVSKKIKYLTSKSQTAFGQMIGTIQETYQGERVVKIYDGFKYETERFESVNKDLRKLMLKTQKIRAAGTPLTQLITMCGVAIVVVFALIQAQAGYITIGEFMTFITAMLLLMQPIKHLSNLNGSTAAMSAAAESLFKLIDEVPEKDPGEKELKNFTGHIRFENVSFKYPGTEKPIIENFSLDVKPGQMIAFVGASGSGKSTLINLIPRFWKPTTGEIYFDEIPQSELTLKTIRKEIGLVSQEVVIFDDTIAGNIAYGRKDSTTREEIEKAADAAALSQFISELPDGFDSRVGANGNLLSGGQRQRVSIARAFLKNAPVVLLDEATSALDTESEKHIQKSLDELMKGRTSFVVAHRLSTVINADLIVVLDKGKVVETGTHDSLLEKKGVYFTLWNVQFQGRA